MMVGSELSRSFPSINRQIHYGWARRTISVNANDQTNALLTSYAYETDPGKPITAGQTWSPKKSAGTQSPITPSQPTTKLSSRIAPGFVIPTEAFRSLSGNRMHYW
jgi:hypothetical protein